MVLSLWTICMLAAFTVLLSYTVRQKITLVRRLDNRSSLRLMADAGAKMGILDVKIDMDAGDQTGWTASKGVPKQMDMGGNGLVEYSIIDEESKININIMERAVIGRLFESALGIDSIDSQELAASIVDWRDGDSTLSIPIGSAEDRDYRGLLYPYEASDSDFTVIDELLLVKGIDEDIYKRIRPFVTIYGGDKVNANTASQQVLMALGMDKRVAEMIYMYRVGEDGIMGTMDDNVFTDKSNIVSRLSRFYNLSDSEVGNLSIIVDRFLDTEAQNFTIKSVATKEGSSLRASVVCVTDRTGKVLYWHET